MRVLSVPDSISLGPGGKTERLLALYLEPLERVINTPR